MTEPALGMAVLDSEVVWVLLGLSVLAWTLILRKALLVIGLGKRNLPWLSEVVQLLSRGRRMQALACLEGTAGSLERIVAHGLRLSGSRKGFEKRVQIALRLELTELRRDLGLIAALAVVAPLLGLLGTVLGMVQAFSGLAEAGAATDSLSAGISEALFSTQTGLVIAVPVLIAHKLLSLRIQRFGLFAEGGLTRVARVMGEQARTVEARHV